MSLYTQPKQDDKTWTQENPDGSLGPYTPGIDCVHCGLPGFDHDRERVYTDNGRYHYDYRCPE